MSRSLMGRVLSAVVLLAACASAHSAIVLRTGVNAGGTVLASGALDPAWGISLDNRSTFNASRVLYPAQICCSMETVAATAAWVSDPSITANSSSTAWGIGQDVWLRTTFDLTNYVLSTVSLTGVWRIADNAVGVYLNGNLLPGTTSASTWFTDFPLSIVAGSSFFQGGLNTLELRGTSVNSGWDGFYFNGAVDGRLAGTVPVPATLPLVLLGLGGLWASRRRAR
jgi:hypothetical protein